MSEDQILYRCSGCLANLPRSDFYANKSRHGGVMSRCKACDGIRSDKRDRLNPEALNRRTAISHARSPERQRARRVLRQAVQSGLVVKWSCCAVPDCGFHGKPIHGHHPDYSQPLSVVWLCADHHRQAHKESV